MADETTEQKPQEEKPVETQTQKVDNETAQQLQQYQTRVAKQSDEIRSYKERLSAFGDTTPEQVEELKEFRRQQAVNEAQGNPDQLNQLWQQREAEVRAEFSPIVEAANTRAEKAEAELKRVTVVSEMLNKHMLGLLPGAREDAEARILKYADKDEAGNFRFLDEAGNVRYSPTDPSRPMTAEEFNAELKALKPHWYQPDGINKGSRQEGQATNTTRSSSKYETMTVEQWLAVRHTVEDRAERVRIDKKLGL